MAVTLHLFSSNTCPHCPATKDFAQRFSKEQRIDLVEHNIQTTQGLQDARYFGVNSVPTIIFFDPEITKPIGLRGLPANKAALKALQAARGEEIQQQTGFFSRLFRK